MKPDADIPPVQAERPARVVVADDNTRMLAAVAGILARECRVVGRAVVGRLLVREVERLCPDIVVLDISRPSGEGLEVARCIRESDSQIGIIFVTAHDDSDYHTAALEAGATGYVVKTRIASDLLPAVRAVQAGRSFIPSPEKQTQPE